MSTQVSIKKTTSILPVYTKMTSSSKLPLLLPLPLYRTHKHTCERCGKRCHIMYEIGKTDCICEQYVIKNDFISKLDS